MACCWLKDSYQLRTFLVECNFIPDFHERGEDVSRHHHQEVPTGINQTKTSVCEYFVERRYLLSAPYHLVSEQKTQGCPVVSLREAKKAYDIPKFELIRCFILILLKNFSTLIWMAFCVLFWSILMMTKHLIRPLTMMEAKNTKALERIVWFPTKLVLIELIKPDN